MQIIDLVDDLRPTILAARQVRDARNTLATLLPYKTTQAVSYRLGRRQRADQTAPVRAIDAPATPIRRPGVVEVRGDLPAITPIVDLSEGDLTQDMILAQQLAGIEVDWQSAVDSSAALVALTVDNTFEAMRGQVLSTLALALQAEDGTVHDVDFGAEPGQITTVTNPWDGANADPFADFAAAHEAFADRAGDAAQVVLTTRRVQAALLRALVVKYPNSPVGQAELSAYLSNNGLPQVMTYDRRLTAYDGTKSRVYPEGHMTFLPSGEDPVGRTEMGVTQEAVQQVSRVQPNGSPALTAGETPGITIVTLGQDNPVQRSVKAAALGMPVLAEVDQIAVVRGIFG